MKVREKPVSEIENIYEEPQPVWEKEVLSAIEKNDVDRLRLIPIELGFHHENWKFIQDICVRLSDHEDTWVRANSLLGIEYAARFRGRVEKNIVKPVLLRALKDSKPEVSGNAEHVIEGINMLMGWKIGTAKHRKKCEKHFEANRAQEQKSQ